MLHSFDGLRTDDVAVCRMEANASCRTHTFSDIALDDSPTRSLHNYLDALGRPLVTNSLIIIQFLLNRMYKFK